MPSSITTAWVAAVGLALTAAGPARPASAPVTMPGARAFPESITSTADGTLYVGSIVEGGIWQVAPGAAEATPWIEPAAHGTRSIFGVLADERAGTLWACSNDMSWAGIASPGEGPGSKLMGFDLATGGLKSTAALPGAQPFCNDIAVDANGRVYASDILASRVLRLTPDAQSFEVWAADAQLQPEPNQPGVDGLEFGSDGALYLTTYGKGELFRIAVMADGSAGEVTRLVPSRPLIMPDTLRLLPDGGFLLVEGGGTLDVVTVAGDQARIETLAGGFKTPVSVARVDDTAWVAEGQLGHLFDPALKDQAPQLPFRIVPVPLAGR